jgi:hypothetical protein
MNSSSVDQRVSATTGSKICSFAIPHAGVDVHEHGGLDTEPAFEPGPRPSAREQPGALRDADLDVIEDSLLVPAEA